MKFVNRLLLLSLGILLSTAVCAQDLADEEDDLESDSLLDVLQSNEKAANLEVEVKKTPREQLQELSARKAQQTAEASKSYVPPDPNAARLAEKKQAYSEWSSRKNGEKILSGRSENGASPVLDVNLEEGLMGSFNRGKGEEALETSKDDEFKFEPKREKASGGANSLSNSFK